MTITQRLEEMIREYRADRQGLVCDCGLVPEDSEIFDKELAQSLTTLIESEIVKARIAENKFHLKGSVRKPKPKTFWGIFTGDNLTEDIMRVVSRFLLDEFNKRIDELKKELKTQEER